MARTFVVFLVLRQWRLMVNMPCWCETRVLGKYAWSLRSSSSFPGPMNQLRHLAQAHVGLSRNGVPRKRVFSLYPLLTKEIVIISNTDWMVDRCYHLWTKPCLGIAVGFQTSISRPRPCDRKVQDLIKLADHEALIAGSLA